MRAVISLQDFVLNSFVITGIAGFRNRGVEAFTAPTVDQIQRRWPDASVTVVSRTPEYDAPRIDRDGVEFVSDGHQGLRAAALRRVERVVPSPLSSRIAPGFVDVKRRIKNASAVIVLGGDIFSSS